MRRGEAWKPLREHGGWMRLSEKAVFYALLDRADNADCSIPAWMTPSLRQLAEACGCSKSTAALALAHLELHSWVTRERVKPGRGHKTAYQLTAGFPCPADCPVRQASPPAKGSDSRTFSEEKESDSRTQKGSDSHPQNRRSTAVSDEGIAAGREEEEGEGEQAAPALSGWPLTQAIIRVVHQAPGGGLHRNELASMLHNATGITSALMVAYKLGKVDFCGQYVVMPPQRKQQDRRS